MVTAMLLAKSSPNETLGCAVILSVVPCAVRYHSMVAACESCVDTVRTTAKRTATRPEYIILRSGRGAVLYTPVTAHAH